MEARFFYETMAQRKGASHIAGGDEVGRGCLAGPVVAAFCVLDPLKLNPHIDDSKKLTPQKREELYTWIIEHAKDYAIGMSDPREVDLYNIVGATKMAFMRAAKGLKFSADFLLLDALALTQINTPQMSLTRGDTRSLSIGAASILAKVTRDRLMKKWHTQYPEYGFETNVGYGTRKHLRALKSHGVSPLHRFSFAPVAGLFSK